MKNSSIGGLGFSIRSRMDDGGKSMIDVELGQELFEPSTVELSTIVCDNHLRETITAYYGFLDERFSLGFSDVGYWLSLYPFRKIIYCNKEKLLL